MESLRHEMHALVVKLDGVFPQPGSIEESTLEHLRALCVAADHARQAEELNDRFVELRQYWLHSIDWCSQLSKDIEKLLIMQEERATGDHEGTVSS